jgi:tRNA(fMet)-specific endonuclease VapC
MLLLDSDTLTHLFEGHPRAAKRLQATQDAVGTTVVSWIEVLQGRFDFLLKAANGEEVLRAQELLDRTRAFLADMDVRPWDARAVGIFEQLRKMKGVKKVGRADLLIASIALAHRAILVTRNTRHFGLIPDLELENWVD